MEHLWEDVRVRARASVQFNYSAFDLSPYSSFQASRKGSTYDIGICAPPNKTAPSAAIVQREATGGTVLGKLDLVNLVGGGSPR